MQSPLRARRLRFARRRSDNPDVTILQQELEYTERQLHETRLLVDKLRAELEEKTGEADALRRVGEATGSAFDLEEMLKATAQIATQVTGTDSCQVYLYDKTRDELVLRAADESAQGMIGKIRLKLGEGITGWVARERKHVAVVRDAPLDHRFKYFPEIHEEEYESMISVPLVNRNEVLGVIKVADVRKHPDYLFPDVAEKAGLCSLASVPMVIRGRVVGVLNCYTEKVHSFTREEIAILQALSTQAAFAVEHAKLMVRSAVIQEMHHRVKNNLQQIASLVRLQTHFSKFMTVDQALGDTLNRILAIAAVHELLSRDDLDTVSIKKVAEQI